MGEAQHFAKKMRGGIFAEKRRGANSSDGSDITGATAYDFTIVFRSNFVEEFPGRGATRGIHPYWDHSLGLHLRG